MTLARIQGGAARRLSGLVLTVLTAASLASCSASHTTRSRHATGRVHALEVAYLPGTTAPGTGPGYREILSARGAGSRSLGRFSVTAGPVYIQISCYGPPPLTVPGVLSLGPCGGRGLISTDTTSLTETVVDFRIKASPKMSWAIYVSQAK